jgi:hypothetical protein
VSYIVSSNKQTLVYSNSTSVSFTMKASTLVIAITAISLATFDSAYGSRAHLGNNDNNLDIVKPFKHPHHHPRHVRGSLEVHSDAHTKSIFGALAKGVATLASKVGIGGAKAAATTGASVGASTSMAAKAAAAATATTNGLGTVGAFAGRHKIDIGLTLATMFGPEVYENWKKKTEAAAVAAALGGTAGAGAMVLNDQGQAVPQDPALAGVATAEGIPVDPSLVSAAGVPAITDPALAVPAGLTTAADPALASAAGVPAIADPALADAAVPAANSVTVPDPALAAPAVSVSENMVSPDALKTPPLVAASAA